MYHFAVRGLKLQYNIYLPYFLSDYPAPLNEAVDVLLAVEYRRTDFVEVQLPCGA